MTTLISFLGKGNYGKDGYRSAKYRFDADFMREVPVVRLKGMLKMFDWVDESWNGCAMPSPMASARRTTTPSGCSTTRTPCARP